MTVYEQMTNAIDSFTNSTIEQEKIFNMRLEGNRGMIDGAIYARDNLTVEAAELIVY